MFRRIRVLTSIFLTTFFVVSMLSGHRHLNPIGDLISGEKSDSGVFLRSLGRHHRGGGTWLSPGAVVFDHSCLACFWDDVRTLGAYSLRFAIVVAALRFPFCPGTSVPGAPPPPRGIDRGPPPEH